MFDVSEFEKENLKDNFYEIMMDFPFAKDSESKKRILQKAMQFSEKIPEFKGWPHNDVAFWNAEAFMWSSKIDSELRQDIKNELAFRVGEKNLDLGSGNVVYTPNTISIDYSPEMLEMNDNKNKILHDLEKPLPFATESFDSITAVFLLNYIKNIPQLIKEARRVLKLNGKFTIVQPQEVNDLYYLHVKNNYDENALRILLKHAGFRTDSFSKTFNNKKINFFFCEKKFV
ncbi:MAG: class I SAM-dependent methyltransferase [Nanoarchaeota archaeon]|nr:class I SAM-dependent methyltransferase [Nanoarchaeota archaeon]